MMVLILYNLMKIIWKRPIFLLIFVKISFIMYKTVYRGGDCLGEIIAVLSGKGGTGKTSLCAGLSVELARQGKRVLCVDCDVGLRNLDISLGMSDCAGLSFLDVCQGGAPLEDIPRHPGFSTLRFLTAPMNCPAEDIDPALFSGFLRRARESFDYIFLDSPAGVDAMFRLVSSCADRCLLVTLPSPAAIRDACRVGELLELAGKHSVKLVVNRVDKGMLGSLRLTIDDVMDTAGLPLLGVVMEDSHVTLAAAFGKSLSEYAPRCTAARAFQRIANRLQGIPQPMKLR